MHTVKLGKRLKRWTIEGFEGGGCVGGYTGVVVMCWNCVHEKLIILTVL